MATCSIYRQVGTVGGRNGAQERGSYYMGWRCQGQSGADQILVLLSQDGCPKNPGQSSKTHPLEALPG